MKLGSQLQDDFGRGPFDFLNRTRSFDHDETLSMGAAESILAWFGNHTDKSYELWAIIQGKQQPGATTSDERHQPLNEFPLLLALMGEKRNE